MVFINKVDREAMETILPIEATHEYVRRLEKKHDLKPGSILDTLDFSMHPVTLHNQFKKNQQRIARKMADEDPDFLKPLTYEEYCEQNPTKRTVLLESNLGDMSPK